MEDQQYEEYKELSAKITQKTNEVENLEEKVKTLRKALTISNGRKITGEEIKSMY